MTGDTYSRQKVDQIDTDAINKLPESPTKVGRSTSLFVNGHFPRRPGRVLLISAVIGFLLTVAWSASFVDSVIGDTTANAILGHDAKATSITGVAAGILFAFVSGLAGTFTACNIAVFGSVAPLVSGSGGRWNRVLATLRPLMWLAIGMVVVSAVYGVVVGLVGTNMPQFTTSSGGGGIPARLVQSMVVFGLIGVIMSYLGLASLGFVPDPFARIAPRFPNAPLLFMGALVGAFLIGRPFPLFGKLFRDAAESGNPLYGAAAFVLQSIGNIVVLTVLMLLVSWLVGGKLQRWLTADARRLSVLTGAAMIVAGVFLVFYWDIRLPSALGVLLPWYPLAPWV